MRFSEVLDQLPNAGAADRGYGEPYRTEDGVTVITVSRIGRAGTASPIGVVAIHGDQVKWVPVVDGNRIALIGVVTGLLSAVIAASAVLRRPPWPDLRGR